MHRRVTRFRLAFGWNASLLPTNLRNRICITTRVITRALEPLDTCKRTGSMSLTLIVSRILTRLILRNTFRHRTRKLRRRLLKLRPTKHYFVELTKVNGRPRLSKKPKYVVLELPTKQ